MADATLPSPPPQTDSSSDSPAINESISESFAALMRGDLTDATSGLLLKVVLPAGAALLMLMVTYFIAKLISRWVSAAICKRVDQTLGRFAGKFAYYTIMTIGGLAILQTAGIGITSFAAIMAAAGFAIGLAFQGTLSNFASGVLLLVFRPFKVGDVVQAAGVSGKVNEIDLFTTTLDTPDNRRLIIPNSAIAETTIENISHHPHRRVDVEVGVGYMAGLSATREVLTRCAEALADLRIDGEGRGYQIVLSNLGASSVDWTVRFWTATENYFAVKEALTVEIKQQLDASGIDIPFPQMQLHITDPEATHESHLPEQALPIPKMNVSPGEVRPGKIRPRARGTTST